ncbi:MAG: hypothetical protein HYZ44_03670 [Bacteroidetes bacterium]|nr:hypothetical protein [Bacteroidota bacterium]
MIHFKNISLLIVLLATATLSAKAQTITAADSTGLPGDNFSLEGALELFKKSTSPEEFEKLLNTEDSNVNNLDLNGDGETDYINVIDQTKKGAHAFVLQVAVSETENQDIAVIELEKTGNDKAVAQIVGDEDMYGEQTIVEPTEEVVTNAGTSRTQVVVNVWAWPSVRYVYAPAYGVWASPYRWRNYPGWWRPWRPIRYRAFYAYRAPYRSQYVVVSTHRVVRAHRVYVPHRVTSVAVHTRHGAAVSHYRTTRTVRVHHGAKRVRTTRTVRTGGRKH